MKSIIKNKDTDRAMQNSDIHQAWEKTYQTESNHKFFNNVFDYLNKVIPKAKGNKKTVVLDAGCGTGGHSANLLRRGFSVMAIDLSEYVLKDTESKLKSHENYDSITFKQEDITRLSFDENSFDCVLCWGVLMHVPDVKKAISELSRVLKPDGVLIIGEANMFSLQSLAKRSFNLICKKSNTDIEKTTFGIEKWQGSSKGVLLTRQMNMRRLKKELSDNDLLVEQHIAGQFTELYIKFSNIWFKNIIHLFNHFWFSYIKSPKLAFGNIVISKKIE